MTRYAPQPPAAMPRRSQMRRPAMPEDLAGAGTGAWKTAGGATGIEGTGGGEGGGVEEMRCSIIGGVGAEAVCVEASGSGVAGAAAGGGTGATNGLPNGSTGTLGGSIGSGWGTAGAGT